MACNTPSPKGKASCSVCNTAFMDMTDLRAHYANEHEDQRKQRKMKSCGMAASSSDSVNNSSYEEDSKAKKRSEMNTGPYFCKTCAKGYKSSTATVSHYRTKHGQPRKHENVVMYWDHENDLEINDVDEESVVTNQQVVERPALMDTENIVEEERLPKGYGISKESLRTIKRMVAAIDTELGHDFSQLKKKEN